MLHVKSSKGEVHMRPNHAQSFNESCSDTPLILQ